MFRVLHWHPFLHLRNSFCPQGELLKGIVHFDVVNNNTNSSVQLFFDIYKVPMQKQIQQSLRLELLLRPQADPYASKGRKILPL